MLPEWQTAWIRVRCRVTYGTMVAIGMIRVKYSICTKRSIKVLDTANVGLLFPRNIKGDKYVEMYYESMGLYNASTSTTSMRKCRQSTCFVLYRWTRVSCSFRNQAYLYNQEEKYDDDLKQKNVNIHRWFRVRTYMYERLDRTNAERDCVVVIIRYILQLFHFFIALCD